MRHATTTPQVKKYFTGQKILILKHSYLAWCNSDKHCYLAVSLHKEMSFLPQHWQKVGNLIGVKIQHSYFLIYDIAK